MAIIACYLRGVVPIFHPSEKHFKPVTSIRVLFIGETILNLRNLSIHKVEYNNWNMTQNENIFICKVKNINYWKMFLRCLCAVSMGGEYLHIGHRSNR